MRKQNDPVRSKPSITLWKFIGLMIVFAVVVVALFAALVYVFVSGVQNMGLPTAVYVVIFVVISGVFAWLLKRISDAASSLSRTWFPEDTDPPD